MYVAKKFNESLELNITNRANKCSLGVSRLPACTQSKTSQKQLLKMPTHHPEDFSLGKNHATPQAAIPPHPPRRNAKSGGGQIPACSLSEIDEIAFLGTYFPIFLNS